MALKRSTSMTISATSLLKRSARASSRDRCANSERRFGRPVSGSGRGASCGCSEMIELWITRAALLGEPLGQPAVRLAVVIALQVEEHQAADERVVEVQRADDRRLQRGLEAGAGRVEDDLRIGVDERAAMVGHPARELAAVLD